MRWFKQLVSCVLMVSVLLLLLNNAMFWHIHITETGAVVKHAHPFSSPFLNPNTHNLPLDNHTHDKGELLFWAAVYNALAFATLVFAIHFLQKTIFKKISLSKNCIPIKDTISETLYKRGPPTQ